MFIMIQVQKHHSSGMEISGRELLMMEHKGNQEIMEQMVQMVQMEFP